MEKDPSGIKYEDVGFCQGKTDGESRLMAAAVSARVDIFNLSQSREDGKSKIINSHFAFHMYRDRRV